MGLEKPNANIISLQPSISNIQTTVNTNKLNVDSLQSTINSLQNNVSTNTTNVNTLLSSQYFKDYSISHKVGEYRSHGWGHGASITVSTNRATQNALEAFPFLVVDNSIICDKMGVAVGTIASTGTHNTILGIYADNNGYPSTLIASTGIIDCSSTGWKEGVFTGGDITLSKGMYWIARMSGGDTQFNGLSASHCYPVNLGMAVADSTYDQTNVGVGTHGVKYTYGSWQSSLPSTFPSIASGAKWLSRTTYCSPWIRRKA